MAATAATQQRQPVPRPFPTPVEPGDARTETARPTHSSDPTATGPTISSDPPTAPADAPTEAMLGAPIYPAAQYLASYDAGRGQRFYLFGTNSSFDEMVRYYAAMLDDGGDRVFDAPATHQFETARFRDEYMDYRPSVTVKDYTWNGAAGYLNPSLGSGPERFITLIQFATAPPTAPGR